MTTHNKVHDDDLKEIKITSKRTGYPITERITASLQGCICRCTQLSTDRTLVIKVTNIDLYLSKTTRTLSGGKGSNKKSYQVHEDILNEISILRYLTNDKECPATITKFVDSFKSERFFFLVMEDGGRSVFDFVWKAHKLIEMQRLHISEWHRVIRVIFKQMVDSIDYIHSRHVTHFDVSLENFLLNDINVCVEETTRGATMKFRIYDDEQIVLQTKLCDFGLAQYFAGDGHSSSDSTKFCGKPHYMSPEMANRKRAFNAESNDVWSLAVCLYIMAVGNPPWSHPMINDANYRRVMNGDMLLLLRRWRKFHHMNTYIYDVLESCFQPEAYRVSVADLKRCEWFACYAEPDTLDMAKS